MNSKYALVVLRVFLGSTFALAVLPKIAAGSKFGAILLEFLQHSGMSNSTPFYWTFLSGTVLPHIGTFAVLVIVAESTVAVALITGTATRLAGVLAMFLVTNYMFAKGMWWWYPSSNDAPDFFIALALIIGAAGRTLGFDAWLSKRWPRIPIW